MNLHELLVRQGSVLFKWRSFLPLLLIFPAIAALGHSEIIEEKLGDQVEDALVFVSFCVSLIGLALRCYTVGTTPHGTSGRSTRNQRADVLNTTGMYSIVKNPLYFSNFIAILGILLSFKVWYFLLIGLMAYWIYIERIIAIEERFLSDKFGDEYKSWAARTPIFLPRLSLWTPPLQTFRLKKVLRNEYYGLMVVSSAFFLNEFFADILFEKEPFMIWLRDDWFWIAQFIFSASAFVTLRFLKKKTNLLSIPQGNG